MRHISIKDGQPEAPYWICSRFDITAMARDPHYENWERVVEFKDQDGQPHAWALPMELLKGDGAEYRGELLRMGLEIAPTRRAHDLLTQFILSAHDMSTGADAGARIKARARCTDVTGWHGHAFVLPNHRTLANGAGERVIFQSATNYLPLGRHTG